MTYNIIRLGEDGDFYPMPSVRLAFRVTRAVDASHRNETYFYKYGFTDRH
jgi:hypothetical protein